MVREKPMADLVERQAVKEWLEKWVGYIDEDTVARMQIRTIDIPSAQPEIIRCKDCKNSEHWYRDRRRCFLWSEGGLSVFNDGFCNYAKRRTDETTI